MALYALGDLHLSFGAPDKSMDTFGPPWIDHEEQIRKHWLDTVTEDDTIVLAGDFSWGRKLAEVEPDLDFVRQLPGTKIFLRGNHDMFWDAKRTSKLNRLFDGEFFFLQNNHASYGDCALVGTKGYCFENLDSFEHFRMIQERELQRLQASFDSAVDAGFTRFIVFLHYPPTSALWPVDEDSPEFASSPFTELAESYGAEQVIYAHCHGEARFGDSLEGTVRGVDYHLVSGDYLEFKPYKVLD
jgi:predicted phosphohydrolase